MLIPIKRVFVTSNREPVEILLNTEYIIRIEPVTDSHEHYYKAKTLIVFDNPSSSDKVDLIYTNYDIPYIKGLYTQARNRRKKSNRS